MMLGNIICTILSKPLLCLYRNAENTKQQSKLSAYIPDVKMIFINHMSLISAFFFFKYQSFSICLVFTQDETKSAREGSGG